MRSNRLLSLISLAEITILFLMAIMALLISSCGGGTTGTGSTGSIIQGKVLTTTGEPVSQALISITETGDTGNTDAQGAFGIETQITSDAITLLIEKGSFQASAVVDELSPDATEVEVEVELNQAANTARIKKKRVSQRPSPTPTPVVIPTIPPTAIPVFPTPTSTSTTPLPEIETPTPLPEPNTTSTPTVTEAPATPTPTVSAPVLRTKYQGSIATSDPSLLIGTEIGISGKGRRPIEPDGTFKFFVRASNEAPIISVHQGDAVGRVLIGDITEFAKKVTLQLTLERRANGNLKLSVSTIEIIERGSPSDNEEDSSTPTIGSD